MHHDALLECSNVLGETGSAGTCPRRGAVKGIKPSLYTRKVDIYTALPTGGDLVTLSSELQSRSQAPRSLKVCKRKKEEDTASAYPRTKDTSEQPS